MRKYRRGTANTDMELLTTELENVERKNEQIHP
uniref:Uncharacterized protein n=1 Tax=Anguilla anguilla TaxID=7936 RepID=A0A0E9QN25_ANGAN